MTVNLSHPRRAHSAPVTEEEALDRAVGLIFAAQRNFWRAAEEVLAEHGLGPAHYRALFVIRRAESQPVSSLRRRLGVRKQSLARVLVDLHRLGMIERRLGQTDRRNRLLTLTPKGRQAEKEATAALHNELRKVAGRTGPQALAGSYAVLVSMAKRDEETA